MSRGIEASSKVEVSFGLDNKYRRWYAALVSRPDTGKETERHHILPHSMGGKDVAENVVRLSCRNHFRAHWLLIKFTEGRARQSMLLALWRMSARRQLRTSWQYHRAKIALKEANTGTKFSSERKAKISESHRGRIWVNDGTTSKMIHGDVPEGWRPGLSDTHKANLRKARATRKPGVTYAKKPRRKFAYRRRWVTNGTTGKFVEGEVPEGFWFG